MACHRGVAGLDPRSGRPPAREPGGAGAGPGRRRRRGDAAGADRGLPHHGPDAPDRRLGDEPDLGRRLPPGGRPLLRRPWTLARRGRRGRDRGLRAAGAHRAERAACRSHGHRGPARAGAGRLAPRHPRPRRGRGRVVAGRSRTGQHGRVRAVGARHRGDPSRRPVVARRPGSLDAALAGGGRRRAGCRSAGVHAIGGGDLRAGQPGRRGGQPPGRAGRGPGDGPRTAGWVGRPGVRPARPPARDPRGLVRRVDRDSRAARCCPAGGGARLGDDGVVAGAPGGDHRRGGCRRAGRAATTDVRRRCLPPPARGHPGRSADAGLAARRLGVRGVRRGPGRRPGAARRPRQCRGRRRGSATRERSTAACGGWVSTTCRCSC